jgi:uncharacterized HhH-GPD family protein
VTKALHFTPEPEANELIASDPLALLIGMLLDQQIKIEQAFLGPYLLKERLGGPLDAGAIGRMDPDELVEIFRRKPALHRYPANMAKRTQALCAYIEEHYGGEADAVWKGAADGSDLEKRLMDLPGFGEGKVNTMIVILGKRLGEAPPGWEAVAPDHMTLGDVESFDDIGTYREYKQAKKQEAKNA